ncbi:MAG: hypothetical protein ACRDN9_13195 [Streptosporangiaceae bacterium]
MAGGAGLAAVAVSVALMVVLGALGPSAIQPRYGSPSALPPWFTERHPPDLLVYPLVIIVLLIGAVGVGLGLLAVRKGWAPRPRWLLVGGVLATATVLLVPSMGTTDVLHYAASGRIATLGGDPYTVTPELLASIGDPVGQYAMADPWAYLPSNYGPLATVTEWLASMLGGASALRTVWWIAVFNGAAFVSTAVLLDRLAGSDRARRVRVHLAWSLNPIVLWQLVVGAHVDGLAVAAMVAALAGLTVRRGRGAALAGLGSALACAARINYALLVPGFMWGLRHDRRRLAFGIGAGGIALAMAFAPFLPGVLSVPLGSQGTFVAGASPWAPVYGALSTVLSRPHARLVVTLMSAGAFLVVAALLARGLPEHYKGSLVSRTARPTAVIFVAWLFTTPHAAPWYDAAAWAFVPLLPVSWFAVALLVHTTLLSFGYLYLPGNPIQPAWLAQVAENGALHYVLPVGLTLTAFVIAVIGLRRHGAPAILTGGLAGAPVRALTRTIGGPEPAVRIKTRARAGLEPGARAKVAIDTGGGAKTGARAGPRTRTGGRAPVAARASAGGPAGGTNASQGRRHAEHLGANQPA